MRRIQGTSVNQVGLFMSDTGGGHRSAGRAIEAALTLRYPDTFPYDYFDVFRACGYFPWNRAPEIYPLWVRYHEPSWNLFVTVTDRLLATRPGRRQVPRLAVHRARGSARWSRHWDTVVVLHPAFNKFAADSDALKAATLADAAVRKRLHNHTVERVIAVPGKLVSNVVR
ncbi:MAG: hypothetical protein ABID40_01605 [Candidatus Bipolaricaulota bacterium]